LEIHLDGGAGGAGNANGGVARLEIENLASVLYFCKFLTTVLITIFSYLLMATPLTQLYHICHSACCGFGYSQTVRENTGARQAAVPQAA
jgi:hypothetical protein